MEKGKASIHHSPVLILAVVSDTIIGTFPFWLYYYEEFTYSQQLSCKHFLAGNEELGSLGSVERLTDICGTQQILNVRQSSLVHETLVRGCSNTAGGTSQPYFYLLTTPAF